MASITLGRWRVGGRTMVVLWIPPALLLSSCVLSPQANQKLQRSQSDAVSVCVQASLVVVLLLLLLQLRLHFYVYILKFESFRSSEDDKVVSPANRWIRRQTPEQQRVCTKSRKNTNSVLAIRVDALILSLFSRLGCCCWFRRMFRCIPLLVWRAMRIIQQQQQQINRRKKL